MERKIAKGSKAAKSLAASQRLFDRVNSLWAGIAKSTDDDDQAPQAIGLKLNKDPWFWDEIERFEVKLDIIGHSLKLTDCDYINARLQRTIEYAIKRLSAFRKAVRKDYRENPNDWVRPPALYRDRNEYPPEDKMPELPNELVQKYEEILDWLHPLIGKLYESNEPNVCLIRDDGVRRPRTEDERHEIDFDMHGGSIKGVDCRKDIVGQFVRRLRQDAKNMLKMADTVEAKWKAEKADVLGFIKERIKGWDDEDDDDE